MKDLLMIGIGFSIEHELIARSGLYSRWDCRGTFTIYDRRLVMSIRFWREWHHMWISLGSKSVNTQTENSSYER